MTSCRNAANIISSFDGTALAQGQPADTTACPDTSKKGLGIIVRLYHHVADAVAVAVERTFELVIDCANGHVGLASIVEVGIQAEEHAALVFSAVHTVGQLVEVAGGEDEIGFCFRSKAWPRVGCHDGVQPCHCSAKAAQAVDGQCVDSGADGVGGRNHLVVNALGERHGGSVLGVGDGNGGHLRTAVVIKRLLAERHADPLAVADVAHRV